MYIRTKDGIYKVSHLNAYATHKRKGETLLEGYKTSYIKNENIIAQSENLEELCDCIIETKGHTGDYFHYTYTAFDEPSKERLLDDMINQDFEVYYAIWASKGLIYVAKMDDEGDLRLL